MKLVFTETAINSLEKISKINQKRIIKKLEWFLNTNNFVYFTKPLINRKPVTHRLRIGDYRVLVYFLKNTVFVVNLGHRKNIYKKKVLLKLCDMSKRGLGD